jgi:predicted phage terminase large subunit-like protein
MITRDQEALRQIAANWRLTPATFATKLSRGQWIAGPWLQYASTRIALGIARGGARIIISAPPRHGKSELVSVYTPTWVLENFPNRNVMLTGYGSDLTEGFGQRVRQLIWENEDLLRVRIPRETSRVEAFQTNQNGKMFSVGLGGAITGRGAHVLLIDDYIKEIKEALSPTTRDYIWNWFVTVAMTRLEPGASVIIIATRWHSDDLIGRILKNFPDRWENIRLPAIAEEGDLLGRGVGEPLFPERYQIDYLEGQRELLGSIFFNALFQQIPADENVKMADASWLKMCHELPATDFRWIRVWDLAATEGGGDYTAGSLVGYSKSTGKCVIANTIRRQLSPQGVEELVRNTAEADGLAVPVGIEQEPGSSGKALVHHYATVVLPEFKVIPINPAGRAKIVRAQPFLAAAEAGNAYLLNDLEQDDPRDRAPWINEFTHEFDEFPNGPNDDQVDTVAAGYAHLSGKKSFNASWGRGENRKYRSGNEPFRKQNSLKVRKASFRLGALSATGRKLTFGR